MVAIGDRIKMLRNARKMTQSEFAERLGVTKSAVSSYENGSRLPSYDVLIKMARIFKVSVDNLLGHDKKIAIDATGLTQEQINIIQEIVLTYKRYNILLSQGVSIEESNKKLMSMMELSEADIKNMEKSKGLTNF